MTSMYAIKEKTSELYLTSNGMWAHKNYRNLFSTRKEAVNFYKMFVKQRAAMSPMEIIRVWRGI